MTVSKVDVDFKALKSICDNASSPSAALEFALEWAEEAERIALSVQSERDALAEAMRVRDTATEPPTEEDRVLAFMELMGGDHAWIEVSTRIFLADTHAMPKWLPLPILKENDSE